MNPTAHPLRITRCLLASLRPLLVLAACTSLALPAQALPERLDDSASPRSQVTAPLQWRTTLPQGLEGLAPGMFARLWLPAASTSTALASVPHSAVVRRAEMTGVYVLNEQGQPRLRQVRLGRVLPAAPGQAPQVEILSGLRNGERVATDPQAAAQVR